MKLRTVPQRIIEMHRAAACYGKNITYALRYKKIRYYLCYFFHYINLRKISERSVVTVFLIQIYRIRDKFERHIRIIRKERFMHMTIQISRIILYERVLHLGIEVVALSRGISVKSGTIEVLHACRLENLYEHKE